MKRLLPTCLLITVALSLSWDRLWIAPLAWIIVVFMDPAAFRIFRRWRFILFLVLLIVGMPLIIGARSATILGVAYAPDIFKMNFVMAQRSVIILLAIRIFTDHVPLTRITQSLKHSRMKNLSCVMDCAFRLLPSVESETRNAYRTFRRSSNRSHGFIGIWDHAARLIARLLMLIDEEDLDNHVT